jgi:acyl carrier protein
VMAEETAVEILRNALGLEPDVVLNETTRLQDIPNLDSLGQVRMVMEIEKVVGTSLSMDEIIALESVGHIRDLLVAKGKGQNGQ